MSIKEDVGLKIYGRLRDVEAGGARSGAREGRANDGFARRFRCHGGCRRSGEDVNVWRVRKRSEHEMRVTLLAVLACDGSSFCFRSVGIGRIYSQPLLPARMIVTNDTAYKAGCFINVHHHLSIKSISVGRVISDPHAVGSTLELHPTSLRSTVSLTNATKLLYYSRTPKCPLPGTFVTKSCSAATSDPCLYPSRS